MQVVSKAEAHLAKGRPSLRKRQQGGGDQAMCGADVCREQRPSRRLVGQKAAESVIRRCLDCCAPWGPSARGSALEPREPAVREREGASSRGRPLCHCPGRRAWSRHGASSRTRGAAGYGAQGCSFGHAAVRAARVLCARESPTRREAAADGGRCVARLAGRRWGCLASMISRGCLEGGLPWLTWAAWAVPRGEWARHGPSGTTTDGPSGRCSHREGRRHFRPARHTARQALIGPEIDRAGHHHHHAVEAPAPLADRKLRQQLLPRPSEERKALARRLHGQLGQLGRWSGSSAG